MKIMVFDVPAEHSGALTILNQYYDAAIKDKKTEWIFIVSTSELKEQKNIKVLNFPWIKKSWFHRLYFDIFIASRLVKQHKPDGILSLQNVIIPYINIKQTLYLHQSLPFVEKRFRITENFKFWIYQNIIGKMIIKSIKDADEVIVQTKWVRDAAIIRAKVKKEKFILKQPELNVRVKQPYKQINPHETIFFYPASALIYKNHEILLEACILLKKQNINNYKMIFTLKGDENRHINRLYKIAKKEKFPVEFIGPISIDEVYNYYSKSTLLFPSYIETFGLPLLEARMHGCPIITSDCAFSNEILEGYDDVEFFDPFDARGLSELVRTKLNIHN